MADTIYPPGEGGGGDAETTETYSKQPKLSKGEAKRLKERFRWGCKYYEKAFQKKAERCRDLYWGYHWPRGKGVSKKRWHYIVVNYLQSVVETIVASVAFQEAEVLLEPQTPESMLNADRSERATNWAYREAKAHRETRRALKDCVVYGLGVISDGWLLETENDPAIEGRPPIEGEPPDPEAVLASIESGEPPVPIVKSSVTTDRPFVKRLDPRQFRVSPEADWVIDEAPWCGYVEVRPLDEVQADTRYRKGITRKLKGSSQSLKAYLSDDYAKESDETKLPSDCKRVCLWHYFEKRRRLHVVFADEEEQPLLVEPWYWKHERYPFRLLFAPGLEDEFYRETPPLMGWEHQQKTINLAASQLATHRNRFNTKIILGANAFDPAQVKLFESDEDGVLIVSKNPNAQGAATVLEQPNLNPAVYEDRNQALQDLDALTGVSQYELGRPPTKRTTTTEVQAIQGAGGARQQAFRQQYEEFCGGVAEDIFDLLQQFAIRTRSLPIYDPATDQIADWLPWDRERIQGDYDFKVHVGSTEVKNRQGKMEEFGYLVQALTPLAQFVNIPELLKQWLSNVPELKNVAAIVQPPMPMMPGVPGGLEMPGGSPNGGGALAPGGPNGGGPGPAAPPPMNGNGAGPPDMGALLARLGPG